MRVFYPLVISITESLNNKKLLYYFEIRSTKSEIRNNIKCSKS
jgi:hypothetical protein